MNRWTLRRPGRGRLASWVLLASTALWAPACRETVDSLREVEAEDLFVRAVTFSYVEAPRLEAPVGGFAAFSTGKRITVTGVGVVVGLDGTGDRGPAFETALAHVDAHPDLRAPPGTKIEPGLVALVMVEGRISESLGTAAGLPGALVRPLGNASSLEGGLLLETGLLDAGTGEVYAVAAGPVLVRRVAEDGTAVITPALGRVMNVLVKARHRPRDTLTLEVSPAWPAVLEGIGSSIREAFPAVTVRTDGPDRIRLLLPEDPLSVPDDLEARVLGTVFRAGSPGLPRLLCDEQEAVFFAVGPAPYLGRGTLLLGQGVRVMSLAPPGGSVPPASKGAAVETDVAIVEVARGEGRRRIRTFRWVRDVVRVLDRLGVSYGGVKAFLVLAADMGILSAEIVDVEPGMSKSLQAVPGSVR